jgi:hypothetical protein
MRTLPGFSGEGEVGCPAGTLDDATDDGGTLGRSMTTGVSEHDESVQADATIAMVDAKKA